MTDSSCQGKREQILEAAIKVFARNGFHLAKVEQIATEANVGKGTVYEYFKSKQDLFQEMLKYIMGIYFDEFEVDISNPDVVLREKLKQILIAHLKFLVEHKDMAQIFLSEHPALDDNFKRWMVAKKTNHLKMLQGFIEEGIKSGEIRDLNPIFTAQIVSGVISSVSCGMLLTDEKLSMDNLPLIAEEAVDILYVGLVG